MRPFSDTRTLTAIATPDSLLGTDAPPQNTEKMLFDLWKEHRKEEWIAKQILDQIKNYYNHIDPESFERKILIKFEPQLHGLSKPPLDESRRSVLQALIDHYKDLMRVLNDLAKEKGANDQQRLNTINFRLDAILALLPLFMPQGGEEEQSPFEIIHSIKKELSAIKLAIEEQVNKIMTERPPIISLLNDHPDLFKDIYQVFREQKLNDALLCLSSADADRLAEKGLQENRAYLVLKTESVTEEPAVLVALGRIPVTQYFRLSNTSELSEPDDLPAEEALAETSDAAATTVTLQYFQLTNTAEPGDLPAEGAPPEPAAPPMDPTPTSDAATLAYQLTNVAALDRLPIEEIPPEFHGLTLVRLTMEEFLTFFPNHYDTSPTLAYGTQWLCEIQPLLANGIACETTHPVVVNSLLSCLLAIQHDRLSITAKLTFVVTVIKQLNIPVPVQTLDISAPIINKIKEACMHFDNDDLNDSVKSLYIKFHKYKPDFAEGWFLDQAPSNTALHDLMNRKDLNYWEKLAIIRDDNTEHYLEGFSEDQKEKTLRLILRLIDIKPMPDRLDPSSPVPKSVTDKPMHFLTDDALLQSFCHLEKIETMQRFIQQLLLVSPRTPLHDIMVSCSPVFTIVTGTPTSQPPGFFGTPPPKTRESDPETPLKEFNSENSLLSIPTVFRSLFGK